MRARTAWRRFEVAFTGVFLTGQPVQARLGDYDDLQRSICDELNRVSFGWDLRQWSGVESYGSGGGYTTVVPLVLARRHGEALKQRLEELQRSRPAEEREWLRRTTAGWNWELRTLEIDLHDFGVGTITGTYEVSPPPWLRAGEIRRRAESVARLLQDEASVSRSPLAVAYEMLARETTELFAGAIERCAPGQSRDPWLQPLLSALPSLPPEWGRLLWLHPVFVFTAGEGAGLRRLRRISRPFEATFSEQIVHWHGLYTPGIDSSVIVLHRNRPKEKTPPMGLTLLMWAYYGLFMEIDRGLLALLDNDRWQEPRSLEELEEDAERIFDAYLHVQEARSRLDSALTDLAGGQLSMWNAISRVQKFDELVAAVDDKLEVLQRIAERRVQEASAARSRRTGNVLSALTLLTVVTVTVALLTSFLGNPTDEDGHLGLRIAVVAGAFAIALGIFLWTRRQAPTREA